LSTSTLTHKSMLALLSSLISDSEFKRLKSEIEAGSRAIILSGLAGSARALVLAALQKETGRRFAWLTLTGSDLEDIHRDVKFFYSALSGEAAAQSDVLVFPAAEGDPYRGASPHPEILQQRAISLYRLSQTEGQMLLLPLRAALQRTVDSKVIRRLGRLIRREQEYSLEELIEMLQSAGYMRQEPVSAMGEFSVRGGILDVFSPARENPVRIEFFGDTVESIREFDSETQRSIERLDHCLIVPMREQAATKKDFIKWAQAAAEHWTDERFNYELREKIAIAEAGEAFQGWEYLLPLSQPLSSSIFDYIGDAVLVVDEPAELENRAAEFMAKWRSRFAEADDAGELALAPEKLFLTSDELSAKIGALQRLELRVLGRSAADIDSEFALEPIGSDPPANDAQALYSTGKTPLFLFPLDRSAPEIEMRSRPARRYHGHIADLAEEIKNRNRSGVSTLVCMSSLGVAERAVEMLAEYGITALLQTHTAGQERRQPHAGAPSEAAARRQSPITLVTVGKLTNGFSLPAAQLDLLIESDIFDEPEQGPEMRQAKGARRKSKAAAFLSDLRDLKPGDTVVHIDHGIGQFQGLQQLSVGARDGNREFMLLTYAEGAKLYVPVERLDLVQKYSSAEGRMPPLDKLGGAAWQKTKERAKRALRDMAQELLKLYAERKLVTGYAFSDDSPWQHEFEEAFEYQLTPDQESTITEVKQDMERPIPMDRLICGDVGFGKTEVAMRAAFKAVMDGKQVAVLTPTTVLAYQHYKTFQKRFAAFPVIIELMSRFRSAKELKRIAERAASGAIDILIGTHRLLSKDVLFRDLGLVIVDEEQRFGVAHKERLKQLKKRVDVLTLSATPIPRTLNMSLMGLRDMSLIETPPQDRLAIQTAVVQFSEPIIRSALELELQRGGQAFFIHNRVESIYTIANLIQRIVPSARIGVGHGQMNEKELEAVMMKFIQHELDVLVSTTIIENGIDIPLANTIIINRADQYGLAQLYQLRGRVGRSNRRAYAYLLIPSEKELTPVARRRLAAIREFSDLGAGFRVAALDLELRGAGHLLGGEQSGHIDAIGFDLYCQMLERTVQELRGEVIEDETRTSINLGIDIRIPEDYIFDMGQRLRTYKRISSAWDEETLQEIHDELEDRYGRIPESLENLFDYSRLRREAERLGVLSIDRKGDEAIIKFTESARVDLERLIELVKRHRGARLTPAGVLKLSLPMGAGREAFAAIRKLLLDLRQQA